MWCEHVIRNCDDISAGELEGIAIDWVDIEWSECGRLLKKETRAGQPVRVLLPPGESIRHNDIVFEEPGRAIAVNVMPCQVVIAHVPDAKQMAILALELGNLHLPVQIGSGQVVFIEDGPAMSVLDSMKIDWTREVRRFQPIQVISSPTAGISPSLRVIIRSRRDEPPAADEQGQGAAGAAVRNSASST